MYYFYILRCADDSLYCGSTNDIEERLKAHNHDRKKGAKYTRSRRPVVLVYKKRYKDKSTALKREHEVKHWSKKKKEDFITKNTKL